MKRVLILLSLALILFLGITSSGTVGLFNDTETSVGNQFTAWIQEYPPAKFHVTDNGTTINRLFTYDTNGDLIPSLSFNLASGNNYPSGAATVGNEIYVLDQAGKKIYKYSHDGVLLAVSKRLLKPDGNSALSNARGLAIDGNEMWVTRYGPGTPILFGYSLSVAFDGSGDDITPSDNITPPIPGNTEPTGLAIDETYLYVLDYVDARIYGYDRDNNSVRFVSQELRTNNGLELVSPNGLMCDGSSIWVVDSDWDMIFGYNLASLIANATFIPTIQSDTIEATVMYDTINAEYEYSLVSENDNASGM